MCPGNLPLPLAPLVRTTSLFALCYRGKFKILVIMEWSVRSQILNSLQVGAAVGLGVPGDTVPIQSCRWEHPLPDTSLHQALEGSLVLVSRSEMGQHTVPSALARSLCPQSCAGAVRGSPCLRCRLLGLPGCRMEGGQHLPAARHLPAGCTELPAQLLTQPARPPSREPPCDMAMLCRGRQIYRQVNAESVRIFIQECSEVPQA